MNHHRAQRPDLRTLRALTRITAAHGKPKRVKVESGVTSMDVYADGSVLHLLLANREKGGPATLWHRRADDAGATWSEPVRVDDGQPGPEENHRGMDVQIAGAGERLTAAVGLPGLLDGGGRRAASDVGRATARRCRAVRCWHVAGRCRRRPR